MYYLINQIIIKLVHKNNFMLTTLTTQATLRQGQLIICSAVESMEKTDPLGQKNNDNNKYIHTIKSGSFGLPGDFGL